MKGYQTKIEISNYHNGRARYFNYDPRTSKSFEGTAAVRATQGDTFIENSATWGAAGSTRAPFSSRRRHRQCGEAACRSFPC